MTAPARVPTALEHEEPSALRAVGGAVIALATAAMVGWWCLSPATGAANRVTLTNPGPSNTPVPVAHGVPAGAPASLHTYPVYFVGSPDAAAALEREIRGILARHEPEERIDAYLVLVVATAGDVARARTVARLLQFEHAAARVRVHDLREVPVLPVGP